VTGDGNNIALTLGDTGIRLPLHRKQFPSPVRCRRPRTREPPRELDLLVPEAGRLPLIGRKDLLAELQAWLDDETDISVHALMLQHLPMMSLNQFPIISRLRQINSRFAQINSRFRLTGIGAQGIDQTR
jgi:hypothetical protein